MNNEFKGTTICAVRKNGKTAIAGDGQVTLSESVIFKNNAVKVRRIYNGRVIFGFAGSVADAFTLSSVSRKCSINIPAIFCAARWNLPNFGATTRWRGVWRR